MTTYTLAMFLEWEHLSNVIRQGIQQQYFKIHKMLALLWDRDYVSTVLGLGKGTAM